MKLRGSVPSREEVVSMLEGVAQNGIPSPGTARLLDVGSSEFLGFFRHELLEGLLPTGGATCRFFEGPNGSGKTHLLQLLADEAFEHGMAVVRADLSQALSLEDSKLLTEFILQNLEAQIGGISTRSLPRVLAALAEENAAGGSSLRVGLPHAGFSHAMAAMLDHGRLSRLGVDLLSRFLLGERISSRELQRSGLRNIKNPLSARNAELVLKTVLAGLRRLGLKGTLLLLDENEKTFQFKGATPPVRVAKAANLMRRIIDSCASGGLVSAIVVFAVLPGFVDSCSIAYEALGQRLHTRRDGAHRGWRSPVLPLEAVSSLQTPEQFLEAAAARFEQLLRQCGRDADGICQLFAREGKRILDRSAGSGYRRALMKELATLTLTRLEA